MAPRKLPEGGLTVAERFHHLHQGRVLGVHYSDGGILWWRLGKQRFEVSTGLPGARWTKPRSIDALLHPTQHVTLVRE